MTTSQSTSASAREKAPALYSANDFDARAIRRYAESVAEDWFDGKRSAMRRLAFDGWPAPGTKCKDPFRFWLRLRTEGQHALRQVLDERAGERQRLDWLSRYADFQIEKLRAAEQLHRAISVAREYGIDPMEYLS